MKGEMIKLSDMQPGLYVLTRNVVNPHGDKSAKGWQARAVWAAGTLFSIRSVDMDLKDPRTENAIAVAVRSRLGYEDVDMMFDGDDERSDKLAALLPALKSEHWFWVEVK